MGHARVEPDYPLHELERNEVVWPLFIFYFT
jgi:hypothetical protein